MSKLHLLTSGIRIILISSSLIFLSCGKDDAAPATSTTEGGADSETSSLLPSDVATEMTYN